MKLQVAPYNNTAGTWAEAEDTKLRTYNITHRLNRPAEATIVLADVDGSLLRKYNADDDDVYIGVGKVTLEDPDGTDIFYGRIKRALGNFKERTLTLECKDWLDQLDDEHITYDMREKLGTTDMRQSKIRADPDGQALAVEDAGGGVYYIYDDGDYDDDGGMAFVNDAYNTYKLFCTAGMAGSRIWEFRPYQCTISADEGAGDFQSNDIEDVWTSDGNSVTCWDNDEDWTKIFDFHVELGHNTPSDFYVHDSTKSAFLTAITSFKDDSGEDSLCEIEIYDIGAAAYVSLGDLKPYDSARGTIWEDKVYTIPLDSHDFVDATGIAKVRFNVTRGAGTTYLYVKELYISIECETTGYASGNTINDTINPNKLTVATDPTTATTQLWEGIPYCIAKPIYLHLESATGLIGGGDTVITLTYGAANIENTSGYSTTQFKNKTRLDIIKTLAEQDKASFWITLGGSTVTYQKTFGAHTVDISDATVDDYQSVFDYDTMFNTVDVYGARIGDYEVYQQGSDAGQVTKYRSTKNKIVSSTGIVSDADAFDIATTLGSRDSEILQILSCTINGNTATAAHATTLKLGDVVGVTSSYLWSTAEKEYVVVAWSYNSNDNKTFVLLHPRSSIGMMNINTSDAQMQVLQNTRKRIVSEAYIPDPITHEVS